MGNKPALAGIGNFPSTLEGKGGGFRNLVRRKFGEATAPLRVRGKYFKVRYLTADFIS